mmetsp:Transcript_16400/g.22189  ORF Transcript_16400/g.22189 Transcript_16400/m.22189 type:complete len:80 (-) Transcript_16400:59-298(-)
MQFTAGQKHHPGISSASSTHNMPASNIARPSTATQIGQYLHQRGVAQPISHSTHTSPQNMLSTMAFNQVPMSLKKKAND